MKTNKQLITSFTAIIFLMAATFLTACSKSESLTRQVVTGDHDVGGDG